MKATEAAYATWLPSALDRLTAEAVAQDAEAAEMLKEVTKQKTILAAEKNKEKEKERAVLTAEKNKEKEQEKAQREVQWHQQSVQNVYHGSNTAEPERRTTLMEQTSTFTSDRE